MKNKSRMALSTLNRQWLWVLALIWCATLPVRAALPFTSGNLVVFSADSASTNNTTFTILELSSSVAGQSSPVNSVAISGTGATALRTSGSATSTGYLADSDDGTLVLFAAHNSATTSGNANALTARGVGTLNNAGTFNLAATYTGVGGNQARGASTIGNALIYIADQGGIFTNGVSSALVSGNFRSLKSFGGTPYVLQASAIAGSNVVSSVSANGTTVTGLSGLANDNTAQDFCMISSGSNGSSYDVLYVLTTAGIKKYSLVSGTWTANSSYATVTGFGICAAKSGSGASLYVTTGTGATAVNNLIKVTDTAGFNTSISVTTGNNVTLYTAASGTTMKGVAFAPIAATSAPGFTLQPASQTIATGAAANLSAGATGNPAPTYQWYAGLSGDTANPIPGATLSSFTTPTLLMNSNYWVRASNTVSTADSDTAFITVGYSTPYSSANINVLTPNTASWDPAGVTVNGTTFVNLGLQGVGRVPASTIDPATGESLGSVSDMQITGWKKNADGTYSGTLNTLPDRGYNNGAIFANYAARINKFDFTFTPYTSATPTTAQDQLALTFAGSTRFTYDRGGVPTFTTGVLADSLTTLFGVPVPAAAVNTTQSDGTVANRLTVDAEGLALDKRSGKGGSGWVSDEYGPYIYHFNSAKQIDGQVQLPAAYLPHKPAGTTSFVDTNVNGRRTNQGMEGLAQSPDGTRLFALMQSALLQDSAAGNQGRFTTRLLVYDISSSDTPTDPIAQYVILLPRIDSTGSTANGATVDRTGAQSSMLALNDHQILILARDGNGRGVAGSASPVFKSILLADLSTGSNIDGSYDAEGAAVAPGGTLAVGVTPMNWTEALNMIGKLGSAAPEVAKFNLNLNDDTTSNTNSICEKWEALSLVSANDPANPNDYFLFIGNDNDFLSRTGKYTESDGTIHSYDAGLENDTLMLVWRVRMTGSFNQAPFAANTISNQTISLGSAFSFTFAANTFVDPESQPLTYTATKADDSALPAWLSFNPATRTFSGTPGVGDLSTLAVKVTATDNGTPNLSGSTTFTIGPSVVTGIDLSLYVRVGRYNLPEPTRTTPPDGRSLLAQEASGVTYDWDTDTLFVVGDGGTSVVQVSKTGQLIDSMTLAAGSSPQGGDFYDPEGITYVGNGKFVMTEERDRQLVLFTYVPGTTLSRSAAKTVKLGTFVQNIGLEGVSYDPQTSGFILVKETQPEGIFQTTVDFENGTASNGSPTTENSVNLFDPALANLSDFADVFALSNLPALNGQPDSSHLLVLSQEAGKIVNIDRSGNISSSLTIVSDPGNPLDVPNQQHEGLTMDRNGVLYVVSENGGGDFDHPQLWVYAPSSVPNQAPTAVALNNTTTSIAENTSTSSPIKVADIVVTDDGLGVNNLSVTGADAAFFQITGNALYIKAGTVLDFETKNSYSVIINVDDPTIGGSPDATTTYTLTVTDVVNEVTPGPILIISEVAPWSSGNSPVAADWFEVTNPGTNSVDITGWKMDDSSASLASTVALNGVTSIAPGESVIFIETSSLSTVSNLFKSNWFGANPPTGLQIGSYFGSGVGLSTGGDAVNLYDSNGVLRASVTFGTSPAGPMFATFDNAAGLNNTTISNLSVVAKYGAFSAVNNPNEIGSPGTTGKLIISEVAPWSSGNSPVAADWFEVSNTGALPVDITGWKMDDSSPSFGTAVALNGITSIGPGESVIFIETANLVAASNSFVNTWFGSTPPAGLKIGSYSGSGVGLSTGGDAVNLYDLLGTIRASVSFGASTTGKTFDNSIGLNNAVISQLSVAGVHGAFVAVNDATETGSPGTLGRLVISEVAPWASGNSPGAADWFEIMNTGTSPVDITGWKVDDSSESFAAAVPLSGIASIAPGEAVIFIETANLAGASNSFVNTWFGANPPARLQIGSYTGSGVGLGTTGDAVVLYDSGGTLRAKVSFGTSPAGPSFPTFDNTAGLDNTGISQLSAMGVNRAFAAVNDVNEFGSPGNVVTFLGVASGDSDANSAIVWTRINQPQNIALTAVVATNAGFTGTLFSFGCSADSTKDYTAKVAVTGLTAGTRYYYRFVVNGTGETSGTGTFKTAPAANAAVAVKFAFSGDMDGLMRPYALASTVPGQQLDFYINLGDVIYETASSAAGNNAASYLNSPAVTVSGSSATLNGVPTSTGFATKQQLFDDYNKKYREQFLPVNTSGQSGLKDFYAGQGNYTLYDNHELGNRQYINGGASAGGSVGGASGTDMPTGRGVDARANGSGNVGNVNDTNNSASDYMNRSQGFLTLQQVYLNYQPVKENRAAGGFISAPSDPRTDGTRQLYFAQQWGKNALYVTVDDRTYRDLRLKTSNGSADDTGARAANANRTMLGATQLAWLKQTLLNAQAAGTPWKFISVSDPIDQLGPIGGALSGTLTAVNSDGGKSWQGGYRAERNDLLKFIADNHIQNVVFMATDDHQNRINELMYSPTGQTENQATYVKVPYCFSIVCGPLGATGPETITDHSFSNIKAIADSLATAQANAGVEPVGLMGYPGLHNLVREGDATAGSSPQAVDFYSPDTFNYTVLSVSADGHTLTVASQGINSTAQNSASEYSGANPAREIFSFQIDAAAPTLTSVHIASNGSATNLAKSGDVITVSLIANQPITAPTITIAGSPANVSGSGATWSGSYTVQASTPEGLVTFSIGGYQALNGISGATVSATTDGSSVIADRTPPALSMPSDIFVAATSQAGAVVSFSVTASDSLDPHPEVVADPASGSLFSRGETTVNVTAADAAGNVASGSFTVTVTNTPPVANSLAVTTMEGTALPITLTGSDANGDTLTYSVVTSPRLGVLSGTPPQLTYTPAGRFNGSDTFTFKVNDGTTYSAVATVMITVTSVNELTPYAFAQPVTFPANVAPWAIAAGNFTKGTALDLAIANYGTNTVSILVGLGEGRFAATNEVTVGLHPAAIVTADFNEDGKADLAVANADDNTITVLLGNGDGTFGSPMVIPVGTHPVSLATGDLNRDGHRDIFVANYDSGDISILLNTGTGFAAPVSCHLAAGLSTITAVDLERDGKLDLVVANSTLGTVTVLKGRGDGTFAGTNTLAAPMAIGLAIADFSGDGRLDIATANQTNDTVTVLFADGHGGFTGHSLAAGTNPVAVAAIDFNKDGKPDLAVANWGSGSVDVLRNNGDGTFTYFFGDVSTHYPVGANPVALAVGAFNSDANDDLVAAVSGTDSIAVLLNNFAPKAFPQSVGLNEDSSVPITLGAAGGPLNYHITTAPAHGTLTGTPPDLMFTPDADFNGRDSFKFYVDDGSKSSGTAIVSLSIAAVNDAPSFSLSASDVTVSEDSGKVTIAAFATGVSVGPLNEASQNPKFLVSNNASNLFSAQPAIAANKTTGTGVLTFTLKANSNGVAVVSVALQDSGGTANGGIDTSETVTFTLTITPVNDAPVVSKLSVPTIPENSSKVVNFTVTDVESSPDVFGYSASGTNTALFPNPATSFVFGGSGKNRTLTVTPAANQFGTDLLTLTVTDGGTNTIQTNIAVTVSFVNQAPSFDLNPIFGGSYGVVMNAGAQAVNQVAINPSVGPANESTQTFSYLVSTSNPGLFTVQPAIDVTGKLTFTPRTGKTGSAVLSVRIKDSGPGALPSVNTSAAQTFTITVAIPD